MKHKVADLSGALLDAAVAKAEGRDFRVELNRSLRELIPMLDDLRASGPAWGTGICRVFDVSRGGIGGPWVDFAPSSDWSLGGPIIERERIMLGIHRDNWSAYTRAGTGRGPTPLIAAMRAYVASKFGEEIELP